MGTRSTSHFEIDTWDPETFHDADGVQLIRTRVTKTFTGDLEGTSTAELLMAMGGQEGSAAYVGFELITGRLGGRKGSFVLHHTATSAPEGQAASWTIVPDTGTGELAGIAGEGRIDNDPDTGHALALDYTV